ncbi:MAG: diacylglycerol kinase family protein [Bacilli bacterium]|nr:diacylglycerol kinase family protein [Bacilli bacterium]MDD4809107.1 diacylglycerol kinase family protein [Bacilli bacterium]
MEYKRTHKKFTLKRYKNSFLYSLSGIYYSFKYEQNMIIIFLCAILAIIAGLIFKINTFEWIAIVLLIGLVIATELINTAIEAVVDLTTSKQHPFAKIAKDCSSAAVLVFSIMALINGIIIFLPKILKLI